MKRGAAHASARLTVSQTSQAHSHHHVPARSINAIVASTKGTPIAIPSSPLLEQVEREQPGGDSIEPETRLDAERAPDRERQAHELQQKQDAQHEERALPGLGPVRTADERLDRREPSAERERELDQRLESGRPAGHAGAGDGVVGGPLLFRELDPAREQFGYAIAVRAHRRDLPGGQPQTDEGFCNEHRHEQHGEAAQCGGRERQDHRKSLDEFSGERNMSGFSTTGASSARAGAWSARAVASVTK